jgi:hypothetical protein
MGVAAVISFSEVRASRPWQRLRDALHVRLEPWLERWQEHVPTPHTRGAEVAAAGWQWRPERTGGLREPLVAHAPCGALPRPEARCPPGERRGTARPVVSRTVEPLVGPGHVERPDCDGPSGCGGMSPCDRALACAPGRRPLEGHQAAAQVALERPEEEAQTRCRALPGVALGRERRQTWVPQAAAGRTVLDVAPSWEERARRMAALAPGRWRRPVVGLGRDGADGPTRPASARERHAGPRPARARRASWHGQGRAAKGVRFSRRDDERRVHLLRWHQGPTAAHLGAALQPVTEAGVMPQEQGRRCVVGEGAC